MSIRVQNVAKQFNDFTALDDVSVEIQDGSLVALLGPSGSGKSTLLRVIAGLEQPDSGNVFIDGKQATSIPVHQRNVGFVFQHYAAFKHMTVAQNIGFGLQVRKQPKWIIKKRVEELLNIVQLSGLAKRYPAQLSGGQRQRMALARALAIEPRVLLLDEPFGALDAQVRADLRTWLRRLHEEMHVTTIFVTHDQEEAMDIAQRIVVMNRGKIEQEGTPRHLYEHPANAFVMSFLGSVNEVGGNYVRPHDWEMSIYPTSESQEAMLTRIVHLGFEVRVEFTLGDGTYAWAQTTRDIADELELEAGQIVFARLTKKGAFQLD